MHDCHVVRQKPVVEHNTREVLKLNPGRLVPHFVQGVLEMTLREIRAAAPGADEPAAGAPTAAPEDDADTQIGAHASEAPAERADT